MLSLSNLLVILLIVILLFGANKIPEVMMNLAKGLKIFRDTLAEKDEDKDKS